MLGMGIQPRTAGFAIVGIEASPTWPSRFEGIEGQTD